MLPADAHKSIFNDSLKSDFIELSSGFCVVTERVFTSSPCQVQEEENSLLLRSYRTSSLPCQRQKSLI